MKVTLEISDKRLPFFMELIKSLDFVKGVKSEVTTLEKKQKADKPALLNHSDRAEKTVTHFSSEKVLAKDWLTPEEDKAWKDL